MHVQRADRHLDERKAQLTRDQREALKRDLQRIAAWFDDGFDRQGARAIAVFADGLDNFWATISLPEAACSARPSRTPGCACFWPI